MLNRPWIPGINCTLSWDTILSYIVGFYFCNILGSGFYWPHKRTVEIFPPPVFSETTYLGMVLFLTSIYDVIYHWNHLGLLFISVKVLKLLAESYSYYFLMGIFTSIEFVIMFPLPLLILIIWVLSPLFLMSLARSCKLYQLLQEPPFWKYWCCAIFSSFYFIIFFSFYYLLIVIYFV